MFAVVALKSGGKQRETRGARAGFVRCESLGSEQIPRSRSFLRLNLSGTPGRLPRVPPNPSPRVSPGPAAPGRALPKLKQMSVPRSISVLIRTEEKTMVVIWSNTWSSFRPPTSAAAGGPRCSGSPLPAPCFQAPSAPSPGDPRAAQRGQSRDRALTSHRRTPNNRHRLRTPLGRSSPAPRSYYFFPVAAAERTQTKSKPAK